MKNKKNLVIVFTACFLLSTLIINSNLMLGGLRRNEDENRNNRIQIKSQGFWNLTGSPIIINELNPNLNWSKTATDNDWCTGTGVIDDPYIIENVTIDGLGIGRGIYIRHSNVYFIVRNCTIYNSEYNREAIYIYNCTNGEFIGNNCSDSNFTGIMINNCMDIICSKNLLNNNLNVGIMIVESNNVTAYENKCSNNNVGIVGSMTNNTHLSNNIANNNRGFMGIYILGCYNGTITGNYLMENSRRGVAIQDSNNFTISSNYAGKNGWHGIELTRVDNIIVSNNSVFENGRNGVEMWDANGCLFYNNYLIGHITNNAFDDDGNNDWNTSVVGNYWDDYSGKDENNDGIGDTPYQIPGSSGSIDYLPIFKSLDSLITVNAPFPGQTFGKYSPVYEVIIESVIPFESWYTLDDGNTNYTFTGTMGIINETAWDDAPNGHVTIKFYARNFIGLEAFKEVIIIKDYTSEVILDIDIINENFSLDNFTITFYVHNEETQGITNALFEAWWDGVEASHNISSIGGGLYYIVLDPIVVLPHEAPILFNMTISASGYEDLYFELYLAVDPDTLENDFDGKKPSEEFPLLLTITISAISASAIIGIVGIIWLRKRRK